MDFRAIQSDPFYNTVIFKIESHILERDQEAQTNESLTLTDSDIKSALRKTMALMAGKQPLSKPKKAKDRWKGALAIELTGIYESLHKEKGLTRTEFKMILLTIEDSLKTRHVHHGHSRGYLDFLQEFIGDIKAREAEAERDQ